MRNTAALAAVEKTSRTPNDSRRIDSHASHCTHLNSRVEIVIPRSDGESICSQQARSSRCVNASMMTMPSDIKTTIKLVRLASMMGQETRVEASSKRCCCSRNSPCFRNARTVIRPYT